MFPVAGVLCGIAAVILLGSAISERRLSLLSVAVVAFCGVFGYWSLHGNGSVAAWTRHLDSIRPRMKDAILFTKRTPAAKEERERISLPAEFEDLTYNGELARYRDAEGTTWYLFPQFLMGIDNGIGFAWSEKGTPPPQRAMSSIVRTKPLGEGWYLFWLT